MARLQPWQVPLVLIVVVGDLAHAGEGDAGAATAKDADSLLAAAREQERLASPDKASALYEELHARFPTHLQAATALAKAFELRLALDELDQALVDGNLFLERFGRRRPADGAAVSYRMAEIFEKRRLTEELVTHLRGYLTRWGKSGGPARLVSAHFKLGEILWKRSCPREEQNSACVELKYPYQDWPPAVKRIVADVERCRRTLRRVYRGQCRPRGRMVWNAIERDARLAREAQSHFAAAVRSFDQPSSYSSSDHELWAGAAFAAAGSAFYQAEQVYEQLLQTSLPPDLDFLEPTQFDPKRVAAAKAKKWKESSRRLLAYLAGQERLAERLAGDDHHSLYWLVVMYRVPHWQLAALARMGQVYSYIADGLYAAEIPKNLREQDPWGNRPQEIFCDTLVGKAGPFEAKAVRGYEVCRKSAAKEHWSNEWSVRCEEDLSRIHPDRYPRAGEILPEPDLGSPIVPPALMRD